MLGLVEAELVDEDLRELVVPVLPGVDNDLVDPGIAQRDGERRRLDELRPVADDGQDAHRASLRGSPSAEERPDRDGSSSPSRAGSASRSSG